jgi:c-di-GMP-binding flagellar brake protein YcgR
MPQDSPTNDDGNDNVTRVTDASQIANLLKRIKDGRSLLTVTVRGEPDPYLSAVLEVNPQERYFLLDELVPAAGHQALMRQRRANIHTQSGGVEISFNCAVGDAGIETKGAFYRMAFPDVVLYRQRRAHFRARIARAQTVPVLVTDGDGGKADGLVRDISAGGIGAEMTGIHGMELTPGQIYRDVLVRLFVDLSLNLNVELRFRSQDERTGNVRIGGRLIDIGRAEQKLIEQFVASLDREWRRKLAKD